MKNILISVALGGLALASVLPALASDEALYGAAVPEDAVFVRWLDEHPAETRHAFGFEFKAESIDGIAYTAISNGRLKGAQVGGHYSVVADENGIEQVIKEPKRDAGSKVLLLLLNSTAKPIRLVIEGTSNEVISTTLQGQVHARAVNPVNVDLSVLAEESADPISNHSLNLRRGQNVTIAAIGETVRIIENRFGPVVAE